MNVYAIKAYGKYGGGMAIVAAHDEEEAKALSAGLDQMWHTRFDRPDSIDVLSSLAYFDDKAAVIAWHATGE